METSSIILGERTFPPHTTHPHRPELGFSVAPLHGMVLLPQGFGSWNGQCRVLQQLHDWRITRYLAKGKTDELWERKCSRRTHEILLETLRGRVTFNARRNPGQVDWLNNCSAKQRYATSTAQCSFKKMNHLRGVRPATPAC